MAETSGKNEKDANRPEWLDALNLPPEEGFHAGYPLRSN